MIGRELGPYRVLEKIGAGGMGEVYRALDTNLKRAVAIKVLPDSVAADRERVARFQREAEVLASLNHPHIAHIHGLEKSDGVMALVLELVEGPTLADVIARGPIPVPEALAIARQIADALEAAHEAGIIHRDLKPANIILKGVPGPTPARLPDGSRSPSLAATDVAGCTMKVLDFGLAKALDANASSATADAMNAPTITSPAHLRQGYGGQAMTQVGMLLGTAAYMSPEQAKGRPADKRSDIWAFGCVLYEMLTGRRAFAGDEMSDVLASVLKDTPSIEALPGETPESVRRLLRRCFERDRVKRLGDMSTARLDIDDALAGAGGPSTTAAPSTASRRPSAAFAIVTGVLVLVATGAAAGWWRATRPAPPALQPLVRLNHDLGPNVALTGASEGASVVISPDGTTIVFVSQQRLFVRRLGEDNAMPLDATAGAVAPFFKPDGKWVGFFAQGKLKKVSLDSGRVDDLASVGTTPMGGSWSDDGAIVLALRRGRLVRVPDVGGTPAPVTELAPADVSHRWPQVLPGSRAVVYTANNSVTGLYGARVEAFSFADRRRVVLATGVFGRYLASGHLVYVSGGTLFAVRFDLEQIATVGEPWPIMPLAADPVTASAQFDASSMGSVVYRTGIGGQKLTVKWLDAAGTTTPLLAVPGDYQRPRLSPDGTRLAFTDIRPDGSRIVVYDARLDRQVPLTRGGVDHDAPIWTPDSQFVVYRGPNGLWWSRADGSVPPQPLVEVVSPGLFPSSFAGDTWRLAYFRNTEDGETRFDIWTLPIEHDAAGLRAGTPEPFLRTSHDERHPAFSRDGKWIAYALTEDDVSDIYVKPYPPDTAGAQWPVSTGGGVYPMWSEARQEIFYRAPDNRLMVVPYTVTRGAFQAEKPRVWSPTRLADIGILLNFDLARDGNRVAGLFFTEAAAPDHHVQVLFNFFDEVRRLGR